MANINLSTGYSGGYSKNKTSASSIGLWVIGSIFLAVVGVTFFLVFQERSLNKKIAGTEAEYNRLKNNLISGRNMDVIDLQSRIFQLKAMNLQRNSVLDAVYNVEQYIIGGVVLEDFSYDKEEGELKITGFASDNDLVSKQISSFKSLKYFSDVNLIESKSKTEGGVNFTVVIKSQ